VVQDWHVGGLLDGLNLHHRSAGTPAGCPRANQPPVCIIIIIIIIIIIMLPIKP
jgi:hypothetical protein